MSSVAVVLSCLNPCNLWQKHLSQPHNVFSSTFEPDEEN